MQNHSRYWLYALASCCLSACSSIIATSEIACPYAGTRLNYSIITGCNSKKTNYCNGGVPCKPITCQLTPAAVIDFIPSVALDTLLLPIQGVRYASSKKKAPCR